MTRRALRKEDYIEEQFYNAVRDKMSQYDVYDGQHLPSTVILTGSHSPTSTSWKQIIEVSVEFDQWSYSSTCMFSLNPDTQI